MTVKKWFRLCVVGLKVDVTVSKFEENLEKSRFEKPEDYVLANAEGKAAEVFRREVGADVVIGADTVVML